MEAVLKKKVAALFDGEVLRPEEPVGLAANTRVQLTIELAAPAQQAASTSFFTVAQSLNLDGPSDWSERLV